MVVSVLTVAVVPAAAETTYETYAQENVRGSNILHCFNWSYNQIKANLADIAKAGYTAVQTSPVQSPKDYNSSWTDTPNQWWKLYQPLGFSVSNNTWLGTKAELTSLCTEAEKYNIKVVVDIVANHLANNGTDGGTYSYLNSGVENDLKNANYYHTNNTGVKDDNRYTITQYHLGMPDLNTANSYVQQRVIGLLEECIDCGVDGFRFDAAKHIELPTDPYNCKSDFWENVIDGASSYAEENNKEVPFYYGEILGGAGTDISNYTTYMAVTDNYTSDLALDKAYYNAASELASSTYHKGASASDSVLWAESHDTYMGNSGSVIGNGLQNTSGVDSTVINKAWAIVGARADSTALFFARPNSTMGYASTDGNWKSKAVSEVNKFKNHFAGTNEYLASSGNTAYIERGTKGVVISKLDGGGQVNLTAHQMADGTYKDQVTGGTFTVSNGVISGNVDSQGVAVVYNADQSAGNYIEADTLYLDPGISSWKQSNQRYAMYVFNSSSNAWVSMTDSNSDGIYEAAVPSGNWTGVIFCTMNASNQTNSWSNKTNQTVDLLPTDDNDLFTVTGADSGDSSKFNGTWSVYSSQQTTTAPATQPTTEPATEPTTEPVTQPTTEPSSDTYTVYAVDNANWNSNTMNVHYWGDGETSWPGTAMTQYSGNKVFKFDVPKNVSGIIFNVENGSKQTVNIESGITDGAVFVISTEKSGNNYKVSLAPTYYLVGSMNGWSNNDDYAFSITNADAGEYEYKLSGVQLSANTQIKVHSSSDTWYPDGSDNNYTVSADGTYDIYFRPNMDGGNDWHCNYFYLDNVTPYTIKWYDGNSELLKTDTVTHGETPVYSGDTPTKTPDDSYSYVFNNSWSPQIAPATADTDYYAQFDGSLHRWSVKEEVWTPEKGSTIEDPNTPPACELTLRCTDCDKEITVDANVSLISYDPPGCSESGRADYTASANGVSVSGTYYINATGHTYGQPAWQWAEDHKSATATFTCSANDDTQTVTTNDITIDYQSDKTVYTAYATFNGTEYTNSDEADAKLFAGHSLTLEGDIGVNFFINVSEEQVNSGVTVDFAWVVNGVTKTSQYKIDKTKDYVKDHRYKASCYVAAAEMTYDITASVTINEEPCEETNTYTVKRYADKILTDQRFINNYTFTYGEEEYNKLNTLVKSLLDYGTRAQIVFDRTEPGLANGETYYLTNSVDADDINVSVNDMKSNLSNYGLEYVGSTVIYMTESTLRHYYRIVDSDLFNAYKNNTSMDGEKISYCNGENNTIYYDVKNIAAYNMDISHTLTIGSNSYNYSVLTYLKKAISSTKTTENTKELCKAAYRYYTASKDYFD